MAAAHLLDTFVSGLEHLDADALVHGPAAELAGRGPATFDVSSPSMFLDFTLDEFVAKVHWVSDIQADMSPHPWDDLPPAEAAVALMLRTLEERWRSVGRRSAPGDQHFRLWLRGPRMPGFRPLRDGGPTTWVPPLSDAFASQVQALVACSPWSLDQLERFLWVLAGRRQLERFGLLGAWPVDPRRFVCVLSHPAFGAVGVVVEQDPESRVGPVDFSVRQAAEEVVLLNRPDVIGWRERGWEKDGIVWNTDPSTLVTPWSGDRPPRPHDPLVRPGRQPWREVRPPSTLLDPWTAALQDLEFWVEQPMWASAALVSRALLKQEFRRWAAGWVMAPDCFAHVEAFIWSPAAPERAESPRAWGADLRGRPYIPDECALPGQRYLRVGQVMAPATGGPTGGLIFGSGVGEPKPEDYPPQSALRGRVGRHGIAWTDDAQDLALPARPSPLGVPLQRASVTAQQDLMARLLHSALDDPG